MPSANKLFTYLFYIWRHCHVRDIDELRHRLLHVWRGFEQSLIDEAVDQSPTRLHACVHASGGHFEHTVWLSICFLCSCSCSLAIINPRVGHTMDVLSPFISILCHSDWLFHRESCPRLDVVYPGRALSSSPAYTWHCSLHYFFLQAIPLFPHVVTIVC